MNKEESKRGNLIQVKLIGHIKAKIKKPILFTIFKVKEV